MRIAYLINQYPQPSQSFIRREIRALESLGVDVHRYTVRAWPGPLVDPGDQAEHANTRAVLSAGALHLALSLLAVFCRSPLKFLRTLALAWRLGRRAEKGRLMQFVYLAEACVLARWLRKSPVDHLHSHFGTNGTTVALLLHRLGGPAFSFTAHGPEEFDRPAAIKLPEKIAAARFVVAVSTYGRSQLFRWCGREHWSKIHVVHCGIDFPPDTAPDSSPLTSILHPLSSPPTPIPDTHQLVCIARLAEQKGQLLLLDAAANIRDAGVDFRLILAGDGPMRPAIESRITDLGLSDRVSVTGWVSNQQVLQHLRDSRAMILPSFAEGLPVVIMECLATARPVVSTYIAGIPELVDPGVTGYLVPAGDVDALADAMTRVLREDARTLYQMGLKGAEVVRHRHDARTEAGKLLELFRAYARKS